MRVMNKKIWPHQRTVKVVDLERHDKMHNWCKENSSHWYLNGDTFCFSNEKEFLVFCMKWA